MQNRAMMLRKITLARGALELPPKAAIGMPVGAQVVHPQPAAIVTAQMRTEVHGCVDLMGASVRGRQRGRWQRWRGLGMCGFSLTQGTRRLVRQALKRFGLGGPLALGLGRYRWGGLTWFGPSERQHDKEPEERQQSELVVNKRRDHGNAPSKTD